MDRIKGVNITIPVSPYFTFILTKNLFRFVNTFFGFLCNINFFCRYLFHVLMRISEKKVKIIAPNTPPIFVYIIVSKNDIFIASTATGNIAANFQVQNSIMINSFIRYQKYKYWAGFQEVLFFFAYK